MPADDTSPAEPILLAHRGALLVAAACRISLREVDLAAEDYGAVLDRIAEGPRDLAERVERGDLDAEQRMVESSLRLVVSVSASHRDQGLPFLDLVQAGTLGLVRAAERFHHRKGFEFSTYATWWIRQAVARALADRARTVRIPGRVIEKLNEIGRAERKFVTEFRRDPTPAEIAAVTNINSAEVDSITLPARTPVSLVR